MSSENQNEFSQDNIFDEFSQESAEIQQDVAQEEQRAERDIFFYLRYIGLFFSGANAFLLLFILVLGFYSYIQSNETYKEYSFLRPVCSLFLGEAAAGLDTCYGVQASLIQKSWELTEIQNTQTQQILPLLWEVYSLENFNLSKKVVFLLDKTNNRLEPLSILSGFDSLKNTFAPVDKSEISCYDMTISQGNILEVTCDAFAADWDGSIKNLQDGTISTKTTWGTSISRASAFINFLENYESTPFIVLEKPQSLTSESARIWPYTNKTTIQLKLLYRNPETLSF